MILGVLLKCIMFITYTSAKVNFVSYNQLNYQVNRLQSFIIYFIDCCGNLVMDLTDLIPNICLLYFQVLFTGVGNYLFSFTRWLLGTR